MAHKHHLQHLLFNGTKINNGTVIMRLTFVIIKLQIMANSLLTAQVCVYSYITNIFNNVYVILQTAIDNNTCVNFTPLQYRTIYHSRLRDLHIKESDELDSICLLKMRTLNWQNKNKIQVAEYNHVTIIHIYIYIFLSILICIFYITKNYLKIFY